MSFISEVVVWRLQNGWTLFPARGSNDDTGYILFPPNDKDEAVPIDYETVDEVAADYRICEIPSLTVREGTSEYFPSYQSIRLVGTGVKCSACGDERNVLYPCNIGVEDLRCQIGKAFGTMTELHPVH